jgi:hypothetical protein
MDPAVLVPYTVLYSLTSSIVLQIAAMARLECILFDSDADLQELERADAAAAEGRPDADRRWQECFVTALNAAAMKGISHSSTAAADGPGSKQGDRCRWVT